MRGSNGDSLEGSRSGGEIVQALTDKAARGMLYATMTTMTMQDETVDGNPDHA
jgi:hypothetical protein